MYNKDMKLLIKYAIELDIDELRTFNGYKGGDILSFTSNDSGDILKIKEFCNKLGFNSNIKRIKHSKNYEIFCEFGVDKFETDDISIYELKEK